MAPHCSIGLPLLIYRRLVFLLTTMSTKKRHGQFPAELIAIIPCATIVACSHILVSLDLKHPNFDKWAPFFKFMPEKFGLRGHIDGAVLANPNDPRWVMDDSCLRQQLASRIYCRRGLGPCHDARSIDMLALGHCRGPPGQQGVLRHFLLYEIGDLSINNY